MDPTLPNRTHHWWPKVLSSYWAGDDGCVTRLLWDGRAIRKVTLRPNKDGQCDLRTVFPKVISGLRRPIAIQAAMSLNMNLPE